MFSSWVLTSGRQRRGQRNQWWSCEHIWSTQSWNRGLWSEVRSSYIIYLDRFLKFSSKIPTERKKFYRWEWSGSLRGQSDEPLWSLSLRFLCTSFLSRRRWHRRNPDTQRWSSDPDTPGYKLQDRGEELKNKAEPVSRISLDDALIT